MVISVIWSLLVGLGIFLYGMQRLETGLNDISSSRMKSWLIQSTNTPIGSASFGTVITMVLQSSSMVSLLVLAFASAGIIPLYNGIGVLLGANVGTTATGWLVATIGFKLDLEALAIPLFGVGCLSQVFLTRHHSLRAAGLILLGFGLLLFGLALMKDSVGELPNHVDMSRFSGQSAVLYLLVGIAITALIQSSSATMMLTLTALHAQIIVLPEAAALIIGADIGTTSTTLLGSLGASVIKKRLAMAHLIFNVVVGLCSFVFLLPVLGYLLDILNITDPLYSLVAFHSFFNFIGLLCFLPFLKHYSGWISRHFGQEENHQSLLERIPTNVPDAAITAMVQEVNRFWYQGLRHNLQHFKINPDALSDNISAQTLSALSSGDYESWQVAYNTLKDKEDELMHFALSLQEQKLTPNQAKQMTQLLEMFRALIYACKTLKDIRQNLDALRTSPMTSARELFSCHKEFQQLFYVDAIQLIESPHSAGLTDESLSVLEARNEQHYLTMNAQVYRSANGLGQDPSETNDDTQLSTQLNVNREIHHANTSLIQSLRGAASLLPPAFEAAIIQS